MRLCIAREDFEARTGIRRDPDGPWSRADRIVSLRDLASVAAVEYMRIDDYLLPLLDAVTLAGHPDRHPYSGCRIVRTQVDPSVLLVGQRFVERKKCAVWFEDSAVDRLLRSCDIETGPLAKRAMRVLGTAEDGLPAVAHYVPPVIEEYEGACYVLDGIHRSHVSRRLHPSMQAVKILGVRERPPFSLHEWDEVDLVDAKPAMDKRYFDLDPAQFRDLKSVGIDG